MAAGFSNAKVKKIAIIGPECTGKTTLAHHLANHFNTLWVPEYAREFVMGLPHHYNYNDVLNIAQMQLKQINANYSNASEFVFFDTELIITKVWFEVVFKKVPLWIENAIRDSGFDLYLLCNTELPWEPDVVRENGGEMREKLFNTYENELKLRRLNYKVITGKENERFKNALGFLEKNRD